MTDNEIIKALEYCTDKGYCPDCPYYKSHLDCKIEYDALYLINRQKVEIENYSRNNRSLTEAVTEMQKAVKKQSAEIERLKDEIRITQEYIHRNNLEYDLLAFSLAKKRLRDELAKEMVGETNEQK